MNLDPSDICRGCGHARKSHASIPGRAPYVACPVGNNTMSFRDNFDPAPKKTPDILAAILGAPFGTEAAASVERKATPIFSGCMNYFPDALAAVAKLSKIGNDKHNPGQPLHWSKGKSSDHADCLARHLMEAGKIDPETGMSHTAAVAWRALALLQTEIDTAKNEACRRNCAPAKQEEPKPAERAIPGGFKKGDRVQIRNHDKGTVVGCSAVGRLRFVDVVADGKESETPGGWSPSDLTLIPPEPVTQPGGFQAGDRVTVFGLSTAVVEQPESWNTTARARYVAIQFDACEGVGGYYPENVKRIPPADKPATVPLIGGFVKGQRVRVTGTDWVGVADHVSPCGKFIRMQLDGRANPEEHGVYPSELERITAS